MFFCSVHDLNIICLHLHNSFSDKVTSKECSAGCFEWYIMVITLVSGIIIGVLLSYLVLCSRRRWSRNKNPQTQTIELDTRNKILKNRELETIEADSTYQQLDLTKMNKEDNYQSLVMKGYTSKNDDGNDDDSTYTELTKVRDVENNYQSLA